MASKEVTVSSTQGLTRVVSEVVTLLETQREATITAINMAIPSAVSLVELIKHRIKGIHQQNSFERVKDSTKTRVVFKLSLAPLDTAHKGYQPPINASEVTEKSYEEMKKAPPAPKRFENTEAGASNEGPRTGESSRRPRGDGPRSRSFGRRPRDGRGRGRGPRGGDRPYVGSGESRAPVRESETRERTGERRPRRVRAGRDSRRGGESGRRPGRGRGGRNNFNREPGMEKYQLVRNRDEVKKLDNEIFVSNNANPIFAVKDGLLLIKKGGHNSIVIKASGQALPKAVRVAEEIKRRELGLHQQNSFSKRLIKDVYRADEEGLDDVVKERSIEGIEIVLSKAPLDTKHSGYQAPLPASQVENLSVEEVEKL